MLRWPGKLQPRRDEQTLVSTIDIAPTILAACGLSPTKEMRGINLLDVIAGKSPATRPFSARFMLTTWRTSTGLNRASNIAGASRGEWKLIESADGKIKELYHVTADPREESDLAAAEPQRVKAAESSGSRRNGESRGQRSEVRVQILNSLYLLISDL